MISRSDCEPLPKPTLSPFARGYLSLCRCFTAAVWCVPALRVQWFIYSSYTTSGYTKSGWNGQKVCFSTRKFVAWGSTPRPGGRTTPLTLGRHHEPFGSVRIARSPHGIDLAGACFALERAWPAGAGFS